MHQTHSNSADADTALNELVTSEFATAGLNVVFVTSPFDLEYVATELTKRSSGAVIGCTTAGHISANGFESSGMAALSFSANNTRSWTWLIDDLQNPQRCIDQVSADLSLILEEADVKTMFGILLIDGLCRAEEQVAAALFAALPSIPVVGGSAGDNLNIMKTHVMHDGDFRQGVATFTLVSTDIPFSPVSIKHHHPTSTRLVVTKADAADRRVIEFNGLAAAEAYSDAVGVPIEELGFTTFARYPLMVRVGNSFFIRSPAEVNEDLEMTFSCALEEGLVLRLGESNAMIETLRSGLADAHQRVNGAQAILVFDCVMRRLEFEAHGVEHEASRALVEGRAIGFSTYGAQLDALHLNQALVGIAFGESNA